MDVQATEPGQFKNCRGQDLSISRDYDEIEMQRGQRFYEWFLARATRLPYRQVPATRLKFDRRRLEVQVASSASVWLGHDRSDLEGWTLRQKSQTWTGELGRSKKEDLQWNRGHKMNGSICERLSYSGAKQAFRRILPRK